MISDISLAQSMKDINFLRGQEAPLSAWDILFGEAGKENPVEFHHFIIQCF